VQHLDRVQLGGQPVGDLAVPSGEASSTISTRWAPAAVASRGRIARTSGSMFSASL